MIVSFYDHNFKGLQNNASLLVDNKTYKLTKKPIELNEMSCTCEAFTEDIQPTFLIVKDDIGKYVYGCLAGVPVLSKENKTQITATDLKTMLSSDVILQPTTYQTVNEYLQYVFDEWKKQDNQNTLDCELVFNTNVGEIAIGDLYPSTEKAVYDALSEIQLYLRAYDLFLDTFIDLINKKVQFIIGRTMYRKQNVKLWEIGIYNYGKWISDINECQGYYDNGTEWIPGNRWILTSDNKLTVDESKRDIFPIKRKVVVNTNSLHDADVEALTKLLEAEYHEDLELSTTEMTPDFETRFEIYVKEGEEKYKDLPCGALYYDSTGLIKVQVGYRYSGIEFI